MGLSGANDLLNEGRKALKDFEGDVIEAVRDTARVITTELMARTPVWSGKTLRNFVWYAWGAAGGAGNVQDAEGGNTGKYGHTNEMAIGEEPMRAANEAAVIADMESVLAGYTKLGRSLVVQNFSENWDRVDSGSAPTPDTARNPGGVSVLAVQAARDQLGDILS